MKVTASIITPECLYYTCPNCKSSYTKKGKPRKNAKAVVHVHGSEGIIENRETHRVSHCPRSVDVTIRVTGDTRRVGWKKPLVKKWTETQEQHESSSSDSELSAMDEDSLDVIDLEPFGS
jgi:hypothetical protein